MSDFLGELGKKLAERWVALLALPGLAYVAAAMVAAMSGWAHAVDVAHLSRRIGAWAGAADVRSTGGAILVVAAVLAGSILAGFVATALGRLIEIIWTLPGRRPPASWLTARRHRLSRLAKQDADTAQSPREITAAIARADQLSLLQAERPTWIGDRLLACRIRIERAYGLDLDVIWPRLWPILPDSLRADLLGARQGYAAAARLYGWTVMYLALASWWWPALLIGLATAVAAQTGARRATVLVTALVESAVDLHAGDLAARLGLAPASATPSPTEGAVITARLRRSRWDPQSPLAE
ncbi:hypothetical protein ACBJ59_54015 [Nonomuraea sp. MTCD27]|uniref:hypothetical protein n=1 Tax=Nonomuraea sp. MTCD27 TaxID=1676747 RepID=UPI0035BFB459